MERKRAALDGEGQGWLSRRTGATKKRRKAYDGHLYSFGVGFCLFVFFVELQQKEKKNTVEDSPDMEFAHRARPRGVHGAVKLATIPYGRDYSRTNLGTLVR